MLQNINIWCKLYNQSVYVSFVLNEWDETRTKIPGGAETQVEPFNDQCKFRTLARNVF